MNRLAYKWNSIEKKVQLCGVSQTSYSRLDYEFEHKRFKPKEYTCVHCGDRFNREVWRYSPTIFDIRINQMDEYEDYTTAGFYACNYCNDNQLGFIYRNFPNYTADEVDCILEEEIEEFARRVAPSNYLEPN